MKEEKEKEGSQASTSQVHDTYGTNGQMDDGLEDLDGRTDRRTGGWITWMDGQQVHIILDVLI